MAEENTLLDFVKGLLGFYGSEGDTVLAPLVLSAQGYLTNAGVIEPDAENEQATALYNVAVATRVKIMHDGDPKGTLNQTLDSIVLQIKDYSGGDTA